ncbi:MAG: PDZ domain-containing protein, partial [Bacillota bacterium]|nr:PDZ domain-containing protein [Bacillota bacterium]
MKTNKIKISGIQTGSIAEELEIKAGDYLVSVNGKEICDVFDYRLQTAEDFLTLEIESQSGERWSAEIEKDEDEDLGLEFENPLMDEEKSCRNKCIFCFIDQLPQGMRKTLYYKDDDVRLSFLFGNYITMTNMDEEEMDR